MSGLKEKAKEAFGLRPTSPVKEKKPGPEDGKLCTNLASAAKGCIDLSMKMSDLVSFARERQTTQDPGSQATLNEEYGVWFIHTLEAYGKICNDIEPTLLGFSIQNYYPTVTDGDNKIQSESRLAYATCVSDLPNLGATVFDMYTATHRKGWIPAEHADHITALLKTCGLPNKLNIEEQIEALLLRRIDVLLGGIPHTASTLAKIKVLRG